MEKNIKYNAEYWIENLNLQKHPEGGYFSETYRSKEIIKEDSLPSRFSGERVFSTAIYFLLKSGQFSAFHRLKSDEIWNFYSGSSLSIFQIQKDGNLEIIKMGNDFQNGEVFQAVVKEGSWFGAEVTEKDSYSLAGCIMSPGFDFKDFELADMEQLMKEYPQYKDLIIKLT